MSRKIDVVTLSGDEVDDMRDTIESLTAERDRLAEERKASQAEAMRNAMAVGQACIELSEAKASLASAHAAFYRIVLMLVGIGAPLNDNVLGFNGEQRKYLHRILDVAEGWNEQPEPVPAAVPSTTEETIRTATQYAHNLVVSLHRDHYQDNRSFEPFDDLLGLLSQIDNMICGWKEPAAVADAVARDAAVGAAIERAARSLPRCYSIEIEIENGAATVRLYDDEFCRLGYDGDGDTLAGEINTATDTALAAAQKGE